MRALLTSLTVISTLALSTAAFAATTTTTTGTIQALSPKTMTLTLSKGRNYMLPAGFKTAGLKVGERVTVAYETMGKKREVMKITPLQ